MSSKDSERSICNDELREDMKSLTKYVGSCNKATSEALKATGQAFEMMDNRLKVHRFWIGILSWAVIAQALFLIFML